MHNTRALAQDWRRRRDQLVAMLPNLDGEAAEFVRETLDYTDHVLTAIANNDQAAIEELLRIGEARQRILQPVIDTMN